MVSGKCINTSEMKLKFQIKDKEQVRRTAIVLVLFVLAAVVVVNIFPNHGAFKYTFDSGKPWQYETLTAPFEFRINKTQKELEQETKDLLSRELYVYYDMDTAVLNRQLEVFVSDASSSTSIAELYTKYISSKLKEVYSKGIVSKNEYDELTSSSVAGVKIKENETAGKPKKVSDIYSTMEAYEEIMNDMPGNLNKSILSEYNVNKYLVPNLRRNEKDTKNQETELRNSISTTRGLVQSGEKIAEQGMVIDEETYNKLVSLKMNIEGDEDNINSTYINIGQAVIVFTVLFTFFFYLMLFRQKFLKKIKNVAFMLSMIVMFCIVTALVSTGNMDNSHIVYMIPYAILPITITSFFDTRTALFVHITTVTLCTFIVHDKFEFLFLQVMTGMTCICTLKNLYQRSQLFKSACVIVLVYCMLYFGIAMIQDSALQGTEELQKSAGVLPLFAVNGVLMLFAYPFIYIAEKLFGYISDVTLVELANTNNPLLRQFSEVAPGSFQHSLQVSNLAAEAAASIEGNPMLARTGALYHDIGKISNPVFFTENQTGVNPHDAINDEERSAQIIIRHVTDGLQLAKKHGLPEQIQEFIMTHHGRNVAKYFYTTYKNRYPDKEIDVDKFTYPGPLPHSKEMAVLMICDAVEAASRSLKEYTDSSINDLVERIVDFQIKEGAFKDAPITFQNIETVKSVIKEKLKNMYHTRISYPEEKR